LDNTDISTLSKGKTPVSTNGIETYSKKTLNNEIRKLIIANVQLITDKMKIEKVRVNLEANRVQLFGEKNFLVVKREELRAEIITLNAAGFSNVPIRRYQNPLLRPTRDKLKVKRPVSFDNIKKNFQRFFTKTRYYQRFYQQNLPFDSNKIQDIIVNIIKDVSK